MEKRKVVIRVLGGVADVESCPDDVEVQIINYDNDPDWPYSYEVYQTTTFKYRYEIYNDEELIYSKDGFSTRSQCVLEADQYIQNLINNKFA